MNAKDSITEIMSRFNCSKQDAAEYLNSVEILGESAPQPSTIPEVQLLGSRKDGTYQNNPKLVRRMKRKLKAQAVQSIDKRIKLEEKKEDQEEKRRFQEQKDEPEAYDGPQFDFPGILNKFKLIVNTVNDVKSKQSFIEEKKLPPGFDVYDQHAAIKSYLDELQTLKRRSEKLTKFCAELLAKNKADAGRRFDLDFYIENEAEGIIEDEEDNGLIELE